MCTEAELIGQVVVGTCNAAGLHVNRIRSVLQCSSLMFVVVGASEACFLSQHMGCLCLKGTCSPLVRQAGSQAAVSTGAKSVSQCCVC